MNNRLHAAILTLALSVAGFSSASADTPTHTNDNNQTSTTVYIDAPRFVRPLLERWISEYKKVRPEATFAIAKTPANREQSTVHVALSDDKAAHEAGQKTVYFAQYAILPVTTKGSDAARVLGDDQLNTKKLKTLFFLGDDYDEATGKKNKRLEGLTVYTGNSAQSVSQEFAAHYGKEASAFRGKRIVGDDQFLNQAIAKDSKGITINALANIYDLQTRQLKSQLVVLPLDVDKSLRAALSDTATLDDLLATLEATGTSDIPVEAVGLSYEDSNEAARAFAEWVLAEGRAYNHEYGLLNLSKEVAQNTHP